MSLGVPELLIMLVICAVPLVLLASVALVVVFILRNRGGAVSASLPTSETPLDILKARYARGEISREQFDEMKRDLGG